MVVVGDTNGTLPSKLTPPPPFLLAYAIWNCTAAESSFEAV